MKKFNKTFVVYGDSGMQMFNWLSPYIEAAGYKWITKATPGEIGKTTIEINYEG